MATNITSERLLEIVTRTKEYYKFMEQVDQDDFRLCGYGTLYKPEIHLFDMDNFNYLVKLTGAEVKQVLNTFEIWVEGVRIFIVDPEWRKEDE